MCTRLIETFGKHDINTRYPIVVLELLEGLGLGERVDL